MQILNVRVDDISLEEAREEVRRFLNSTGQYKIFTPNPEFLVRAQKDKFFKDILNSGDLNLCDGFGASLFTGIKRIAGADFMMEILKIAAKENKSVYFLGGLVGAAEGSAKKARELFPGLKAAGFSRGPEIKEIFSSNSNLTIEQLNNVCGLLINGVENESAINDINDRRPDILFVAFGMGKQEKWIYENLNKIPSVKIAMGVGGSLDYLSGAVKRAPCWMRKIGLEWIYRLFNEPKRFSRIYNATIKFAFLVLKEKISNFQFPISKKI